MRRATAVVTSVAWFAVTAGVGGCRACPVVVDRLAAAAPAAVLGLAGDIGRADDRRWSGSAGARFVQFVRAGGTPMPGVMTKRLVVTGFNRYVRNPINLGAIAIFLGEALVLWRLTVLLYAIAVRVGAAAFVSWYEEPALVRRFGVDYDEYRRAVPPWRPWLHPWFADTAGPSS